MYANEAALQELIDRKDISDAVHNYAFGADSCNWNLYRSVLADEIELDFSSSYGSTPFQVMSADKWVHFVSNVIAGFDATQHTMSNFAYDIDGDRADVRVYVCAEHHFSHTDGERNVAIGGYYVKQMKRTAKSWKISKCKLIQTWVRGPTQLFDLAAQRVKNGLASRPVWTSGTSAPPVFLIL